MPHAARPMGAADLLMALAVVVLWGLNFIAMKYGLRSFSPFQLGALRYLSACLPMVLLVRPPRIHWKWVVAYGLFVGLGQFGFLFLALKVGMAAGLASVLMQTQVFFTATLGLVLLRERPGRALKIGMGLAALGLLCFTMDFVGPSGRGAGATTLAGFGLTLCAAAMWAGSNIVARRAQAHTPDYDPLAFVVWSSLVPVLPFVALSAWLDPDASRWLEWSAVAEVPLIAWLSIAYLGWAATVVGYAMWTRLLKRHPANRVAPFSLGVPVVGLAAGMLVLGEVVTPWQWGGIACVVSALGCVMLGPRLGIK